VGLAVDQAGGFYVTFGTGPGHNGWQAATTIYTSPTFFTETFPVIDSAGRLVVVFNPNGGVSSIASRPTQTSWGIVQIISLPIVVPLLPSVAANKSGTRLALVYLLNERGLRYCFFNSTTGRWDLDIPLPGAEKATFTGYSADNAFPLAVDETGNVTVICGLRVPLFRYTIGGFRYEGGQWTGQQLLPPSRSLPNPDNFGSIALNANGAVLAAVPTSDGATGVNISVFRHTPGVGWDTEVAAFYNIGGTSRCKVAWFDTTEGVVVYTDFTIRNLALQAALYSDGAWGSAPSIPGNLENPEPKLAAAPTGDVLLGMISNGSYVTFLRP
jgi:hypothetical protein